MEINKFAEKMQEGLLRKLGAGYEIMIQEVEKNNGIHLWGVMIIADEKNVSPTIYLEPFWSAYEKGVPLYLIVDKVIQIYQEDVPAENVDLSFFKSFAKVKERICYRLVHAGSNEKLLTIIPHIRYLDLAVCFYYAYEGKALGNGSILIRNTHVQMWETSVEELFQLAEQNTPRLFLPRCESMETVLAELLDAGERDILGESAEFFQTVPMMVLGNARRTQGAVCIMYPHLLEQIAGRMGSSLYILPSSIHEVIIMPERPGVLPERLKEMIVEVNATQVDPEEKLSDSLYYYNRTEQIIQII